MSGEVTTRETADMSAEIRGYLERQQDIMLAMAGTIKAACEKIDRLEAQIKRMEKVTPEQAAAINELIRTQADQLADECKGPHEFDPVTRAGLIERLSEARYGAFDGFDARPRTTDRRIEFRAEFLLRSLGPPGNLLSLRFSHR